MPYEYLYLVVPSILLALSSKPFIGERGRKRGLFLLVAAFLALLTLILALRTNPYGQEISSSLLGWGTLPVLVALLVMILKEPGEIAHLWQTDRVLLAGMLLAAPVLFLFLWLTEALTFYMVAGVTVGLVAIWLVGTRARGVVLLALSGAVAVVILLGGGGSFSIPSPGTAGWVINGLARGLALFLAAALVYAGLRDVGTERPNSWGRVRGLRLFLALILIAALAYSVFWDGIWSAAHARAFEDNLPFMEAIFSLAAGILLALSLRGGRRWAGPVFFLLVTAGCTLALIWGWNISAFELTEQRAGRVDEAITRFYSENGRYPESLDELAPRYLPVILPPVIVRQGGWCYQGDAEAYRLGYVSGEFTYSRATFHTQIAAQQGDLPAAEWDCDAWVSEFQAGKLGY